MRIQVIHHRARRQPLTCLPLVPSNRLGQAWDQVPALVCQHLPAPQVEFRVLYLFAGRPRKADLKDCLVMHGKDKMFKVVVEEVDITRSATQD